ncbi:hypothetical protein RUMHYD_02497 [Blautia hydrogenotrophica DSM 10507]|uniref:Uncharacterized protein n=1 Tax=Blautia hydrogenotrophica (strain DSM 10507 / JCM 14656 / S5a33) TaxID=476272 RepID=C0CNQ4_BLAHS|nr:hypothetical protein RUMHYD_02497 [Blautia hydrogenotrophica DSM 10507]
MKRGPHCCLQAEAVPFFRKEKFMKLSKYVKSLSWINFSAF